jgi:hypothetical protein
MKTFRRDKLRRLVEAGRVETVYTYHYDDMMGEQRTRQRCPSRRSQPTGGTARKASAI